MILSTRISMSAGDARLSERLSNPNYIVGQQNLVQFPGEVLVEPGWPPRRHQSPPVYFRTWGHNNSGSGSRSHRSPLGGIWRASRRERWDGGGKGSYGRIEGQDGAPWPDGDGGSGSGGVNAGVKTGPSKSETRFAVPEPFSDERVGVIAQGGGPMSTYVMWISIFAATISLGICFCVATIMMEPKSDRSQVGGR
jgi:hypothetical protein